MAIVLAFPVVAFRFQGHIWLAHVTGEAFVRSPALGPSPDGPLVDCPPVFEALVGAAPECAYPPRILDSGETTAIGPAKIRTQFHFMASMTHPGAKYHASTPAAPVYGILAGEVVAIIETLPRPADLS